MSFVTQEYRGSLFRESLLVCSLYKPKCFYRFTVHERAASFTVYMKEVTFTMQ